MDFNLLFQLKNNRAQWIGAISYVVYAVLIITIFCYGVFTLKAYLQSQRISQLDSKIAIYGTQQQKASETKFFDYKNKIEAFTKILDSHKISSNIFGFMEESTLPNVWFSSFNVLEAKNQVNLSGESQDMETLSRQVKIFEESKDYVKNITVLSSQMGEKGNIKFTLNFVLEPKFFNY